MTRSQTQWEGHRWQTAGVLSCRRLVGGGAGVGLCRRGERLDEPLARLKDWLERHNAALVAVILVVIGLLVLYKGIHGLA